MYDIALLEKEHESGLTLKNVMDLYGYISFNPFDFNTIEAYPLDIEATSSCAMGFITTKAADYLDYDFDELSKFVSDILNDMDLEAALCIDSYEDDGKIYRIYEFNNLKIWLNR